MNRSSLPLWAIALYDGDREHWSLNVVLSGVEQGPERIKYGKTSWTEWRLRAASAVEAIRLAQATLPLPELEPRDVLADESVAQATGGGS